MSTLSNSSLVLPLLLNACVCLLTSRFLYDNLINDLDRSAFMGLGSLEYL